jgi:phytoene dehydrogenase-like protein
MAVSRANHHDAIVIGGGHNGLVTAAYLARSGARTVVCEARHKIGGAASTDAPWPDAPEFKVTTYSYVMSLMPERIITDLDLVRHGYKVHPMGPYYLAFPDGGSLMMGSDDAARDRASIKRFSARDAEAYPRWREWLGGIADVLAPLLLTVPPKLGSRSPQDVLDQLKLLWRLRGLNTKRIGDVTRLLTMSIGDLLDDWFESDQVKAALAVDGIIGTWAGPRSPGTAYVLAHHEIGDVGVGLGSWGFPEGGMGAVSDAIHASATEAGATVRLHAPVERILTHDDRVRGVVLANGEELYADVVVTTVHPQITFLRQLDPGTLPDDFVSALRHWKTRSGTVKINLALSELPSFAADPGTDMGVHHTGAIELSHSLDYLEDAFQDARAGRAAQRPFSDGVIPTTFDRTLCPDGFHIMSLFTQWVPETWADDPDDAELEAYADRVIDGYTELAPNFRDAIVHRQVIGPHDMQSELGLIGGNIFHGELSANQLFHMRPAAGYADYRSPVAGLYQASSATHAGGGVCGIPAMLAVSQILADRRRTRRRRFRPAWNRTPASTAAGDEAVGSPSQRAEEQHDVGSGIQ